MHAKGQTASVYGPVLALLAGTALLLMGNGLQGVLLILRAGLENFSSVEIGLLQSAYSGGFVLGCVLCPYAVKRAGHIRAFAALAAIASTIVLFHAMAPMPLLWILLRASTGFCFAGLYTVIESWLNAASTTQTRGQIMSVYTTINLSVLILGYLLINMGSPASFVLFSLSSVLISLALVPVAMTSQSGPPAVQTVRLRIGRLYEVSPVGLIGCLAVGLANGAFWGLAPVFAQAAGLSVAMISFFMGATILGGALSQWPLGRLSDRVDRRKVILAAFIVCAVVGAALAAIGGRANALLIPLSAVFGACALPVYALCVAHANDFAAPEDFVEVSSELLFVYGIGAIVGPAVASMVMYWLDHTYLYVYTASVHTIAALVVLARMSRRAAVPTEERAEFVPVALTTPTEYSLDPRAPGSEAQSGAGAAR